MAPNEPPSTFLARLRTYLDAVRAAIRSYLADTGPDSPDGGTGGAVG